jgi:hypothetical protein
MLNGDRFSLLRVDVSVVSVGARLQAGSDLDRELPPGSRGCTGDRCQEGRTYFACRGRCSMTCRACHSHARTESMDLGRSLGPPGRFGCSRMSRDDGSLERLPLAAHVALLGKEVHVFAGF